MRFRDKGDDQRSCSPQPLDDLCFVARRVWLAVKCSTNHLTDRRVIFHAFRAYLRAHHALI